MLSITDDFRIIHHMVDTASDFGLSQLQLYKDLGANWSDSYLKLLTVS